MAGNKPSVALLKRRNDPAAGLESLGASGMERASRGYMYRTRHLALERYSFSFSCVFRPYLWGRGKKYFAVRMERFIEELFCVRLFHYLSEVHNADLIAEILNYPEIMADEKERYFCLLFELGKEVDYLCLYGDVQGRKRLIRHDYLGRHGKGPCDAYPLPLSAAELMGVSVKGLRSSPTCPMISTTASLIFGRATS